MLLLLDVLFLSNYIGKTKKASLFFGRWPENLYAECVCFCFVVVVKLGGFA